MTWIHSPNEERRQMIYMMLAVIKGLFCLFSFSREFRRWMFSNVVTLMLMLRANGFEVAARVLPTLPNVAGPGEKSEALFCRC